MRTIQFRVTAVNKKSSSEVDTIRYTYENDERKGTRTAGAEWEEIEFTIQLEDQPAIGIANITGSAYLAGNPKLIINDKELFGTYKVGDIIEFMPIVLESKAKVN